MKRIIGITGGIASGKSYVCSVLASYGYKIIDSDAIYKELSAIDMPIYTAIVKRFGLDFINEDRSLNKNKLGKLIFNDNEAKLVLNSVTHPIILKEMERQIKECNDELIFLDIPLLYEAKLEYLCDKIVCVYLNREEQIKRLMNRDSIDRNYAIAKIDSQMNLETKKSKSDYIIDSEKSFEDVRNQINKLLIKLQGEK